jgi:hypothetical protein
VPVLDTYGREGLTKGQKYPIHLAAESGNLELMNLLLQMDPNQMTLTVRVLSVFCIVADRKGSKGL